MSSTPRSRHLALVASLAVAALGAPAAAGAAPTVTFDRSCYSPGEPIIQAGSGFAPDADIAESLGLFGLDTGELVGLLGAPPVRADAQGSFVRRIRAPGLARRVHRREQAVSMFTNQADPEVGAVPVYWSLTAWDVEIKQWAAGRAQPGRTMLVDTFGWTSAGTTLYAHYYRGRTRVKSVKLGALRGECGDMRKRVAQFPFRRARPGRWTVFFSAPRRLDKRADAWISRVVRVSYTASPASTRRWRSVVRRAGSTPSSSTSNRRHSRYCRSACARRPERA